MKPRLKKENVVIFGIVKDSPLCLDLYESISTDRGDRCFEIGDFKENYCFVAGWIRPSQSVR